LTQLEALGPFPVVPLVVLVHDPKVLIGQMSAHLSPMDAERVESLWGRLLTDQASLSRLGRVQTVGGSGHLIHLERPEVALAAIAGLIGGAA
jgi:hypothetical protein